MANVFRCYTEKREGFDVEAKALLKDLTGTLGVTNLTGLRLLNRYDAEGIDEATYAAARSGVPRGYFPSSRLALAGLWR